jgi:hypothetical protein
LGELRAPRKQLRGAMSLPPGFAVLRGPRVVLRVRGGEKGCGLPRWPSLPRRVRFTTRAFFTTELTEENGGPRSRTTSWGNCARHANNCVARCRYLQVLQYSVALVSFSVCSVVKKGAVHHAGLFHHGAHGGKAEGHGVGQLLGGTARATQTIAWRDVVTPRFCSPPWPSCRSPCAPW